MIKLLQDAYQMMLVQENIFFADELRVFCRFQKTNEIGEKLVFLRRKTISTYQKVSLASLDDGNYVGASRPSSLIYVFE